MQVPIAGGSPQLCCMLMQYLVLWVIFNMDMDIISVQAFDIV